MARLADDKQIFTTLPPHAATLLESLAHEHRRSVAAEVRHLILERLERIQSTPLRDESRVEGPGFVKDSVEEDDEPNRSPAYIAD
jgi:hypothetical protein